MLRKQLSPVVTYIVCAVIVFCTLFPIYWLFATSLKTRIELFVGLSFLPKKMYWGNYVKTFFIQSAYRRFFINSLIVASGNTALVVFLALLATFGFSRFKIKGSQTWFFWLLTNRMAPPAIFILPYYLMFSYFRLMDTRIGLILIYCLFNLPFAIWLLQGMVDSIPKELDEAVEIDGGSAWSVLWYVILPLTKPGLVVTAILIWVFAWNEFLFASVLTHVHARTITSGLILFITQTGTDWGKLATVSIVCIIPAIIIIGFVQKHIIAGLTLGAVKE